MGTQLREISIEGFKSIRRLESFRLKRLNVLVGANGAGKSNFISFFRMLRAMADEGLATFIKSAGGADGFFFDGPKVTPALSACLMFGANQFKFTLTPTVRSEMMVLEASTYWGGGMYGGAGWRPQGGGRGESQIKSWRAQKSGWDPESLSVEGRVAEAISSWVVYHFRDTSATAPMRRDQSVRDWRELRSDAGNIAAFLHRMRTENEERYLRIRETLQLIAPFFDDFILEAEPLGDNEVVRLEWRQKGSSFPFQPWQFSDGTIRFICLLAALLQPNPPSLIVIDEPELGLHPFALEILAGLVKDAA